MSNVGKPDSEEGPVPSHGKDAPPIVPIAAQSRAAEEALRDLNNANARETSFLTGEDWRALVASSFIATCTAGATALLIALDQDANHHAINFRWFQARRRRFVYVDRVVVSQRHRGQGLGSLLYRDLFDRARAAGHDRIVCEVNLKPPNTTSDAFHEQMGFTAVGRADLQPSGKTVRYWEKLL